MMKVLFLLPYNPVPANLGNKHLTYNLLRYMVGYAEVDIAMLLDEGTDEPEARDALHSALPAVKEIHCFYKPSGFARVFSRMGLLIRGLHPSLGYYWNSELARWLSEKTAEKTWDVIHFDMIHMSQYARYCSYGRRLLVASDAYSLAAIRGLVQERNSLQRIRLRVESWLLKRVETTQYSRFDEICSVSPDDAAYLSSNLGGKEVRRIGIALGEEFTRQPARSFESSHDEPVAILCTGSLSNRSVAEDVLMFLRDVLPQIRAECGACRCVVWGRGPVSFLQDFLNDHPEIEHIEYVDDYVAFLNRDWVYVYPQRCGTGLQTKVQQAMAFGLPVVGFDIAFNGLDVDAKKCGFLIGDGLDAAAVVIKLVRNVSVRRVVGLEASLQVRGKYSIKNIGSEMMDYYI